MRVMSCWICVHYRVVITIGISIKLCQDRIRLDKPPQFRVIVPGTVIVKAGSGLLESVYEGAFCVELSRAGLTYERQKVYPLHYKGEYIGGYNADIVEDDKIILELKSVSHLTKIIYAQILNYLHPSHLKVGYLMTFNVLRLEWKRFFNVH